MRAYANSRAEDHRRDVQCLARRCDVEALRAALDASLPEGLDVLEIVESGPGGLVERLEASWWRIELRDVETEQVRTAIGRFLEAGEVTVERLTKQGVRTFDARAAVVRFAVVDQDSEGYVSVSGGRATCPVGSCAILDLVVRHTTPAVRPDDVLAALRVVADFAPASPPLVTRLAQGPLDEENGTVADPLAPDRNLAAT